jgi:hypothetical protein
MRRMGTRTRLRRSPKLTKIIQDATHLTRVTMRRMVTRKHLLFILVHGVQPETTIFFLPFYRLARYYGKKISSLNSAESIKITLIGSPVAEISF